MRAGTQTLHHLDEVSNIQGAPVRGLVPPRNGSKENLLQHRIQSPPYGGLVNPTFSIDAAALFRRAPSRVTELSPTRDGPFREIPLTAPGNYFRFLPTDDRHRLAVPTISEVVSTAQRRSSYQLASPVDRLLSPAVLPPRRKHQLPPLSIVDFSNQGHGSRTPDKSPGLHSIASVWSTSDQYLNLGSLARTRVEARSQPDTKSLSSVVSSGFTERMHDLIRAFSRRTQQTKEHLATSPTYSSDSDPDTDSKSEIDGHNAPHNNNMFDRFLSMDVRTSDTFSDDNLDHFVGVWHCKIRIPKCFKRLRFPSTMEPHSKLFVFWLFIVATAFLYNAIVIPLRAVFPYQNLDNHKYWLIADCFCDFIYILDIFLFKPRVRFADNGITQCNRRDTRKHYMKKWLFKLDLLSLTPLDFFYFIESVKFSPWLRLPRLLKVQSYWEFYERCDQASKSFTYAIRIIKTVLYMLLLVHTETCGYYSLSLYEGLNSTSFTYDGQGIAYIRCFYFALRTASSIGKTPEPTNNLEYIFMTIYWLSGVFVFALLIGQIRDIVGAASLVRENYRKKMDSCLWYMQSINLPREMKDKVRDWFLYNWEHQKTIDERSLVSFLPRKLQTDLAINVHFNTLSKVQLFQDCEVNLLQDLVLKLRPILFLPGDYICEKGEVGKEMYIVSQGQVEVLGGENNEIVLATLHEGSVFGEISLLAMSGGGNRRTAHVRSKGYTSVFTLSKNDFETAMTEYPEAQALLRKRAKKILKITGKLCKTYKKVKSEEVIKTPLETPKLVQTVIKVLDPESGVVKHLTPGLRRESKNFMLWTGGDRNLREPDDSYLTLPASGRPSRSKRPSGSAAPVGKSNYGKRGKPFKMTENDDDDVFPTESSDDMTLPDTLQDYKTRTRRYDDNNEDAAANTTSMTHKERRRSFQPRHDLDFDRNLWRERRPTQHARGTHNGSEFKPKGYQQRRQSGNNGNKFYVKNRYEHRSENMNQYKHSDEDIIVPSREGKHVTRWVQRPKERRYKSSRKYMTRFLEKQTTFADSHNHISQNSRDHFAMESESSLNEAFIFKPKRILLPEESFQTRIDGVRMRRQRKLSPLTSRRQRQNIRDLSSGGKPRGTPKAFQTTRKRVPRNSILVPSVKTKGSSSGLDLKENVTRRPLAGTPAENRNRMTFAAEIHTRQDKTTPNNTMNVLIYRETSL